MRGSWFAAHGLALVSLLLSGLPGPLVLILGLSLAMRAWLCVPQTAPGLVLQRDGRWSVPAWGVAARQPGPGSLATPWLIRVVVSAAAGRRTVLLARDSVTAEQWRAIQVLLGC